MPSGNTYTQHLADSLPVAVASARIVREQVGVMSQIVSKETLSTGTGTAWREVSFEQLTAQNLGETDEIDNPQQLQDTLFTVTPTVTGIQTVITDRVAARISPKALAKTTALAQNAIQRLKDTDGLALAAGAANTHAGAGVTLTSGHLSSAVRRISSDATEPGNPPFRIVLHGFQIRDIEDELIAAIGTYPTAPGITETVYQNGYRGPIAGGSLHEAGNIGINSLDDARGMVFAQEAAVLVQGRSPRIVMLRNEKLGGGATEMLHYDEYAFGERSAGNWLVGVLSDASVPTS